jgi:hypothetical protein
LGTPRDRGVYVETWGDDVTSGKSSKHLAITVTPPSVPATFTPQLSIENTIDVGTFRQFNLVGTSFSVQAQVVIHIVVDGKVSPTGTATTDSGGLFHWFEGFTRDGTVRTVETWADDPASGKSSNHLTFSPAN